MSDFWKNFVDSDLNESVDEDDILLTAILPEGEQREIENLSEDDNAITIDNTDTGNFLHDAVENGNPEELKKLLTESNRKYINQLDTLGRTPLYIAAEKNNIECLNILIDKNAEINKRSPHCGTPTYVAAKLKHVECLNQLMKNEGFIIGPNSIFDMDRTAIDVHNAVTLSQSNKLKQLLDVLMQNSNILNVINEWDKMGKTLLHLAIEKNDPKCLAVLAENQADVNKANVVGGTPIHTAALKGREDCLIELLKYKADVNQADIFGESPVYAAALNQNISCFEILMKHGADINKAAYLAAVRDQQNCSMFLIEQGADLSYVSDSGDTTVDVFFNSTSEPKKCMIDILNSKVDKRRKDNKTVYNLNFQMFFTKNERQMRVFSCLLRSTNTDEETEILNHPLCELFLFVKMNTSTYRSMSLLSLVMWYIYFCFVFFYVGSVTDILSENYISSKTLSYIVLGLLPIRFVFGITQILQICVSSSWWETIRATMHVISVKLVTVLVIAGWIIQLDDIPDWFSVLTDVVLVVHYIEYIYIHMRFRRIGNYYVMFLAVLRRTIIALLSFFFLLFSFVIIFQRQFFYYNEFSNIFHSTLKTIVLMIGELEYENTLNSQLAKDPNSANVDISAKNNSLMPRVMFLVFIIFIHISLLNLMTGLAVENVTDAKKMGSAISFRQQAEFLAQAEDFLLFLKNKIPVKFLKQWAGVLLRNSYIDTTYKLEKTRKTLVSQSTFESLNVIARKRKTRLQDSSHFPMASSVYYSSM